MTVDLRGLHVALATPFRAADGAVDEAALRRLVDHVVRGGVDVLLALGTTGEATALDAGERDRVMATCLEHAGGRPVVVGVGAAATATACAFARRAAELGAHALLLVTPYYVRPTQDGLVAHVTAVADAADGLPLVVYNVPGRTAVNLLPATLQRLWQLPAVVAVKESSGSLAQIGEVARTLPDGKVLLAGDDGLALPSIAVGAEGLVSVVANLLPAATAGLVAAARAGRREQARMLHARMLPVIDALFAESSPGPLKAGLAHLGLVDDHLRLPLLPASDGARQRMAAALDAFSDSDAR